MKIEIKLLIIVFILGILGIGYYFLFSKPDLSGNTIADNVFGWKFPTTKFPITGPNQIAYSKIRKSGGIPEGLPVRLLIPIINIDSTIEDALITSDGRMDVPVGSVNVAWFALGPNPGEIGSAVIGGHFGIKNGIKFVFYDLDKLKVDDKIYVINDKGEVFTFQVQLIKLFDRNADATTVFSSDDGLAHLNLITCEGIWNKSNGNYPNRRVVFTNLIEEDMAPINLQFNQTLRIGSYGVNVVALQNALKKIGISPGISDGFFGTLTRTAVAKYQTKVGLQSDGIFGPLTRTELNLEKSQVIAELALPVTGTTTLESTFTTTFQAFIGSLKSLYATPANGLVTSLLLISIIFVILKIVRL